MSRFRSPWQVRGFAALVAAARRLLRPFGCAEARFVAALITRQNRRVVRHLQRHPPRRALLILPRCVKQTGCRVDVQASLAACLACRRCPVGEVAAVCDEHGLEALVAFRSQVAFAMARERRPDVIVATACHDRLIKALRSVPDHPALLAPLSGMDRMCVNAAVDLPWLTRQVALVAPGRRPHPAREAAAT